ncbi:MAG: RlmE family RNA methyltransferase [Rhizobiales bacterium]|nr:RlmE family RNA methyltransferase [Hyphomicrobiales bacterium]
MADRPNRPSGRGGRNLKVKVQKGKGRTNSSRRWLERQLNDPYVAEARRLGLKSRAAFKLIELDDEYSFLKPGLCVVDLGAAPGGWSQVAAQRVNSIDGKGAVVAIDLHTMEPIPGAHSLKMDFLDDAAPDAIMSALGGKRPDVVLSDMAAHATGHRQTDHLKIMALCETALDFARSVLRPDGVFLCKVLRGGTESQLLASMKRDFATVRHVKPKASREDSAELYVLATGFRGEPESDEPQ